MKNKIMQNMKGIVLGLILVFGVSYVFADWANPQCGPTGCNAPTPLNVGSFQQTKTGTLKLSKNLQVNIGVPPEVTNGLEVWGNSIFYGNVGIGIIAPARTLHIGGDNQPGLLFTETGTRAVAGNKTMGMIYDGGGSLGGNPGIVFQKFTDTGGWNGNIHTFFRDGSISFNDPNVQYPSPAGSVAFMGSGSVGIGTVAPGAKLHVKSTTSQWTTYINANSTAGLSNGLVIQAGTNSSDVALKVADATGNTSYLFVRGDGNVGIGTTDPQAKLHVAGTVRIADGTQGANKVLTSDADGDATWQAGGSPRITTCTANFAAWRGWQQDHGWTGAECSNGLPTTGCQGSFKGLIVPNMDAGNIYVRNPGEESSGMYGTNYYTNGAIQFFRAGSEYGDDGTAWASAVYWCPAT